MIERLKRYQQFIEGEYFNSFIKNKDYSLSDLKKGLKQKIEQGHFKRLIFVGMGASAIVGEMIKVFFIEQKISTRVEVINDYEFDYLIDKNILIDNKTLFIINSFGGNSKEPIKFYNQIKKVTKNIIFLTSGGKLAAIAKAENVSLIYWQLPNAEKKYSVLYAPQFFSILLDIFFILKITKTNYHKYLLDTAKFLKKEFSEEKIEQAKQIAKKLQNREIVFLANPKWSKMLSKLVVMHFNELSLAPAHCNYFNEFTHCEVAVFTNSKTKLATVIFVDKESDKYTQDKIQNLIDVLSKKQNKNIELIVVKMTQNSFFKKLFYNLLLMQHIAYFLGAYYNIKSNNLVSEASGNS